MLKVRSVRQMLSDLVMAVSRPELKVSSPQRKYGGQRVLLGDCKARNDVWRYERPTAFRVSYQRARTKASCQYGEE